MTIDDSRDTVKIIMSREASTNVGGELSPFIWNTEKMSLICLRESDMAFPGSKVLNRWK